MHAIELVKDTKTKEPHKEATGKIIRYCYEHGLVVMAAGTFGNLIRLLAPLVTTPSEVSEGLDVLEMALKGSTK